MVRGGRAYLFVVRSNGAGSNTCFLMRSSRCQAQTTTEGLDGGRSSRDVVDVGSWRRARPRSRVDAVCQVLRGFRGIPDLETLFRVCRVADTLTVGSWSLLGLGRLVPRHLIAAPFECPRSIIGAADGRNENYQASTATISVDENRSATTSVDEYRSGCSSFDR